ncbi:MAG: ABC transporter ATP-binding protein/permease [Lactobacillales bacterium]|jgi:ATP-binding cassette subfamily B multidrug efflux pump|nr:ABC transporter ATP-binding protein/permease [Lactobacillales bacterium]
MTNLHSLRRIFAYLRPYRKSFVAVILLIILTIACSTFNSYVTGLPTSKMLENVKNHETIDFAYIKQCLILLISLTATFFVTKLIAGVLMANVVQNSMHDLRKAIQEKINRLPVSYFDSNSQGDVLSRITNDVDAVSNALQQSFISILTAILSILMALVMMFYINPIMTLIAMIGIPLSVLVTKLMVGKSQKYFKGQQDSLGELNGFVQENMTGFSVLKLYGREQQEIAGFKKVNKQLADDAFKASFLSSMIMPLVNFLSYYLIYIIIAVLGAFYVISGSLLVGQLQAFIYYIWQVSQPMGQITQLSAVLQSATASANRLFAILDEPEEEQLENPISLPKDVKGQVQFDKVDFQYPTGPKLIKNLNLTVPVGNTVAIVGPTGAGKTTMINLLMRFYDVTGGKLKIDEYNVNDVPRSEVRALFGMVLQDAWLYNGTIRENIRFGKLDATDEEVEQAAITANVDHFIRTLPKGYDTVIDAEAENISLGQKQLLTIARAVLSNPKILILDEATSSVDTRMERLIQSAMDTVMKGRTSFIIAHRLSTIRNADMILVMNHGSIIEKGTHEELMEKHGFYYKLYQSQFSSNQFGME